MLFRTTALTLDGTDQVLLEANAKRQKWMAWTLSTTATIHITGVPGGDAVLMPPQFALWAMSSQNAVTINGTVGTVVYIGQEVVP
jgi:hypothetical protein